VGCNVIHVRFLQAAPDDEAAARLGRLLVGAETDDDRAAMTPTPKGQGRDPRTMPGWRPGFRRIGEAVAGQAVTVEAPSVGR
jgi:hypothetical protein